MTMTEGDSATRTPDLSFFGMLTAAASHELNNVLCIIGQNTGLVQDLIEMAAMTGRFDQDRLITVVTSIQLQVQKGGDIVHHLNRFAHTVDEGLLEVDIREALECVIALAHRLIGQQGSMVELVLPTSPVILSVAPFSLYNLLWLALDSVLSSTGDGAKIDISVGESDNNISLVFRTPGSAPIPTPMTAFKFLLEALHAQCAFEQDGTGRSIVLTFTRK